MVGIELSLPTNACIYKLVAPAFFNFLSQGYYFLGQLAVLFLPDPTWIKR